MTRPHTVSGLRFHGLNVVDILKGQIVRESQTFFNCCANVCLHSLEMEFDFGARRSEFTGSDYARWFTAGPKQRFIANPEYFATSES